MAREIYEWSKIAARNIFPAVDGGWPEKQFRTSVNDAAREDLRALRQWYDDPEWLSLMRDQDGVALPVSKLSATVVRIGGSVNMTAYFPVNRRVKIIGGTPTPVYAHVVSASYSAPNTDVTLTSFSGHTEVPVTPVDIQCHLASTLGTFAFQSVVPTALFLPTAATQAALQAAIDAANAAGGGTVYAYHSQYLLSSTLTMKSNVFLWGGGWWATAKIKLANGSNVTLIDFPASTTNAGLVDISIDANGVNNAGAASDAVTVGDLCSRILISGVYIKDSRRDSVHMTQTTGALEFVHVRECSFDLPGRHGLHLDDQYGLAAGRFVVNGIDVKNPGAYDNDGSGIRCSVQAMISNVRVELNRNAPWLPRGIWLVQKDGANRHARFCSVTGGTIRGSGDQARGIEIGGGACTITGCVISLTGASSRGIYVDATTGGQVANTNVVTGCYIDNAGTGIRIEGDGENNLFTGNMLNGCVVGIDCIGDKNLFEGCTFFNGTTQVQLQSGAEENVFLGCNFRGGTTQISVTNGANRNTLRGNDHHDATTGVTIAAGATDNVVRDNVFENVTTKITDAGTTSKIYGNQPFTERVYVRKTDGDQLMTGAVAAISQFAAIAIPGLGGNAARKFMVRACVGWTGADPTAACDTAISIQVRLGPLGTVADPIVLAGYEGSGQAGVTLPDWHDAGLLTMLVEVTPNPGDKVTVSCNKNASVGLVASVYGDTLAGSTSTLEIEQVVE